MPKTRSSSSATPRPARSNSRGEQARASGQPHCLARRDDVRGTLSRLRILAYVPDLKLARSFRTALYQETHLVPKRVFADRNINVPEAAHLLAINRED